MRKRVLIVVFLLVCIQKCQITFSQSHYPGQHSEKMRVKDKQMSQVFSFDLQDVRILPGRFSANTQRESAWILSLPVNSLLHSFRTNAGVYSGLEGGYSPTLGTHKLAGWESLDCELRGHTTGHVLSGLALLYASTGEAVYKRKADSIITGLAEVQIALNQQGYLSAFPQELINRNIAGQRVWAPWYTLHKLFSGLIDQYLYCNSERALEVVSAMGEWAYQKLKALSREQRKIMLRNEFGGMNDAFYNLYSITGNEHFRWVAGFFYHDEVLDPLLDKKDILNPKHANTYIPKLIGLAREYELQGEGTGMEIADFFWQTVTAHHSFATGSNSDKEHFFEPDRISAHLSGYTGESCNVYNMLKLTRHLFINHPDARYADYYEKALFNHILGQQDTKTGMISYFLPMLPGAHKVYSTPDSSFWCCVGSGFENQAKYGEAIYYHTTNAVLVNLFISSTLRWDECGLELVQQTSFPQDGHVELEIRKANAGLQALQIRFPSWSKNVVVRINGKIVSKLKVSNGYIVLERKWNNADKVVIDFSMELQLIPANDNPDKAAIAYGPVVLAGTMGTAGFSGRQPYSDPLQHNDYYTYDYRVPPGLKATMQLDKGALSASVSLLDSNQLTFITTEGILLRPLYDIHRERYVVYWDIVPKQNR